MSYEARITSSPDVMLGKPVIKGTRITVELILQKLADGYTSQEVPAMYPNVTTEDVDAVLQYAAAVIASETMIKAA
jgi:uncharacterized protein (DUF433 family)